MELGLEAAIGLEAMLENLEPRGAPRVPRGGMAVAACALNSARVAADEPRIEARDQSLDRDA